MMRRLLLVIVATYVALALAYAVLTPAWQNPDEPAHYNYARAIADDGRLPVLQAGDYDQATLEHLKASKFAGAPDVSAIRYESYQPPLYYALGAALLALTPGDANDLLAARLLSVALGALVIVVVFAIGREAAPATPEVALGAAALVAFIPQHIAVTAAASNDVLGELLLALMTLLAIRRLRGLSVRRFALLGALLLGLALLSKVTAYAGVALLAAGELGHWLFVDAKRTRFPVGVAAGVVGGALLLSGWWFVRNALVYGNLDVLGTARHAAVVVGQPRTELGLAATRHFVVTTFKSFWAMFGWMGVPVDERIYGLLAVLSGLALVGLLLALRRWLAHSARHADAQAWVLTILGLQLALVGGLMLAYNLTFIQPQGRYLFPASAPIAIFYVLGLHELLGRPRLLATLLVAGGAALTALGMGRLMLALGVAVAGALLLLALAAPLRYRALAWAGLAAGLAALDIVCLVWYILPALAV